MGKYIGTIIILFSMSSVWGARSSRYANSGEAAHFARSAGRYAACMADKFCALQDREGVQDNCFALEGERLRTCQQKHLVSKLTAAPSTGN
jgi:hypothetical protein